MSDDADHRQIFGACAHLTHTGGDSDDEGSQHGEAPAPEEAQLPSIPRKEVDSADDALTSLPKKK